MTTDNGKTPFDPSPHLTKVGGSDYLEIRWRLVWLRDRHPDAIIETELVGLDHVPGRGNQPTERAIFKATITLPTGGMATGYGSETHDDFPDHIEKASTKAIGRALAALGFGTQFCPDFEFGAAQGRVVDAPVKRDRQESSGVMKDLPTPPARQTVNGQSVAGANQPATQRQLRYLQAVAREAGLDGAGLDERSLAEFGVYAAALSRKDASDLIDLIQTGTPPSPNGRRVDPQQANQQTPPEPTPMTRPAAPAPEPAAEPTPEPEREGSPPEPISRAQINKLWTTAKGAGVTPETVKDRLIASYHVESVADLDTDQADALIASLVS